MAFSNSISIYPILGFGFGVNIQRISVGWKFYNISLKFEWAIFQSYISTSQNAGLLTKVCPMFLFFGKIHFPHSSILLQIVLCMLDISL